MKIMKYEKVTIELIFSLGVDDPIVCEHPPQQHFEQQQPNLMKFTPIVVNSFIKI